MSTSESRRTEAEPLLVGKSGGVRGSKMALAILLCVCSAGLVVWLALSEYVNILATVMPIDMKFFGGRDMYAPLLHLVVFVGAGQYLLTLAYQVLMKVTGRTTPYAFWSTVGIALATTLVLFWGVAWGVGAIERDCPRRTLTIVRAPSDTCDAVWLLDDLPCGFHADLSEREVQLYPRLTDSVVSEVSRRLNEAGWEVHE